MMKLGTVIPYLKTMQKINESRGMSIFSPEISKFSYINKYTDCFLLLQIILTVILISILIAILSLERFTVFLISNSYSYCESRKIFLINVVTILMMSAKMATLGLLRMKVFLNESYDVIISVHDVTNKILLRDLNYIVDLIM